MCNDIHTYNECECTFKYIIYIMLFTQLIINNYHCFSIKRKKENIYYNIITYIYIYVHIVILNS